MGNFCPCREDSSRVSKGHSTTIVDREVFIYDKFGVNFQGNSLKSAAKVCKDYRPINIEFSKLNKRGHSSVKMVLQNKEKKECTRMVVKAKYRKGGFRIYIERADEEYSLADNMGDFEEIHMFGESEECKATMQDFLNWLDNYNERFDELLEGENNMAKVVFGFFKNYEAEERLDNDFSS